MVRPEVLCRQEEAVQDNPDHSELHQSQRMNTMRAKAKPQNVSFKLTDQTLISRIFLVLKSKKYVENWR